MISAHPITTYKMSDKVTNLSPFLEKCDTAFRESLPESKCDDSPVSEAVRYCLRHPGALVRAQLACQTCLTVGMEEAAALSLATGVEYLHTASLIFDDLPCMDDALERRGFPTLHTIYGEDSAVLAALALVNRANLWIVPISHFKTGILYQPERSEVSQAIEKTRFFAALRMTVRLADRF